MSVLSQILASGNYIPVNKLLIKLIGLEEAIVLGELLTEYNYWSENDKLIDNMFFYCTANKLEENTGLTEYQQRKAIKTLSSLGILTQKLKGIPATRYFCIDEHKLFDILQTSSEKTKELVTKKLHSSNNNTIITKNKKSISKDIDTKTQDFDFGKSEKPKKLNLYDRCVNLINDFTDDEILRSLLTNALKLFLENSKESSTPFYTNTFKGKLNNLKKLSDDNYRMRDIVKQTLDNGWNNFYALKDNKSTYSKKKPSTDIGYVSERAEKKGEVYEKF